MTLRINRRQRCPLHRDEVTFVRAPPLAPGFGLGGRHVRSLRAGADAGFIWDDDDHLTANPAMTAPHGLKMIWSSLAVSRYYPLTLTTFWVQRRLWG